MKYSDIFALFDLELEAEVEETAAAIIDEYTAVRRTHVRAFDDLV